ncbi:hypothetical protein RND81_09G046100 [Saponaria officinalis]|uniref:Bromo domain-containing protein n=1 Tax=Saponaria officinalis TaxID=3572 RepID=A0AAW1IHF7_SAPOF
MFECCFILFLCWQVKDEKGGRTMDDYNAPGTPSKENEDDDVDDGPTPLPDKKLLELILDKLQKKDTYGVYSEPVDPEELPDYHEVIEHPMDFSTVRKKLAVGCYSTLEEFESDVFLISSNAMQYNAPDTIYHKQAHAIKELAEKKFQRIRVKIKRSKQNEPKSEPKLEAKSEQKETPCSATKKQIRKPHWRGMQEPIGSDFSSGATLATEDVHDNCRADLASNHERSINHDGPIEGVSSLADHSMEKAHSIERAEDPQSGKGALPKFGRKLFVCDENRRATYNISNLHVDRPESVFTTFESDKKHLLPVGLSGEYAYARSLARFSANLGPIAWGIASKRIERLLPPGFKYGRGWIGEFEPLSSAVLYVSEPKDPFASRFRNPEGQTAVSAHQFNQPTFNEKSEKTSSFGGAKSPITNISNPQHLSLQNASGVPSNMMQKKVESNCKPSNDQKASAFPHQQIRVPRNTPCSETTGVRRAEPNPQQPVSDHKKDVIHQRQLPQGVEVGGRSAEPCSPSVTSQKFENFSQRQPSGMDIPVSRTVVSAPMDKKILQSLPFGKPDGNGHVLEAFSNGKTVNNFVDSNRAGASFLQKHDQSLSDPVLVMKMLTEKSQRQQNGSQPRSSVPSPRGGEGGNAAAAAASAWMSVGSVGSVGFRPPSQNPSSNRGQMPTDSLYNGTRVFYPQAMQSCADGPASETTRFHPEKNGLLFPAFGPRPMTASNENPVQNRPMRYPQLAPHDLSRFQVQTAWQGLSPHTEQKPKQKQDTLPPDLNVAFQSSVDSQQPDLALQL